MHTETPEIRALLLDTTLGHFDVRDRLERAGTPRSYSWICAHRYALGVRLRVLRPRMTVTRQVLFALRDAPEGCTVRQLAVLLEPDKAPSQTRFRTQCTLYRLEAKGLVRRGTASYPAVWKIVPPLGLDSAP